jgi:hypothetical protein
MGPEIAPGSPARTEHGDELASPGIDAAGKARQGRVEAR